jgi:hypothetical protein
MTDIHAAFANELGLDVRKAPQTDGRALFVSVSLVCLTAQAGWLGFLGWGFGYLIGIW